MTTSQITITTRRTCWCGPARALVGSNVLADSLPWQPKPTRHRIVTVTAVQKGAAMTLRRHVCQLALDGGLYLWTITDGRSGWQLPRSVTVTTTDEASTLVTTARQRARHYGPLSLAQALQYAGDAQTAQEMATRALPTLGGYGVLVKQIRRRQTDAWHAPWMSAYLEGRVRQVASGMWAADRGRGGSIRCVGEYPTELEARAAVVDAIDQTWLRLQAVLRTWLAGDWALSRQEPPVITVVGGRS